MGEEKNRGDVSKKKEGKRYRDHNRLVSIEGLVNRFNKDIQE